MIMADQELKPIHEPNAGDQAWETAKSMKLQQTEPKSTKVNPDDVESSAGDAPESTPGSDAGGTQAPADGTEQA
jgi:hypothetical protein